MLGPIENIPIARKVEFVFPQCGGLNFGVMGFLKFLDDGGRGIWREWNAGKWWFLPALFVEPSKFLVDLIHIGHNYDDMSIWGARPRGTAHGWSTNVLSYRLAFIGNSDVAFAIPYKAIEIEIDNQLSALAIHIRSKRLYSGISGSSTLARLPSINAKDTESDDDRRFFPPWCAFLAPIGVISLLWGWNHIRNETNPWWGGIAFGVGAIFWMYGLVVILKFF